MNLEAWRAWDANLGATLDRKERYTATLLVTLATLLDGAPFDWTLTGGTALQSYLPVGVRRYSTDLEIMTRANEAEVREWVAARGWEAFRVTEKILGCRLTPEGTLFVIHTYPPADYAAADSTPRAFEHFPLAASAPPGPLHPSHVSLEFLVATKLYAIQERNRGGERKKDAYDLALAFPLIAPHRVLDKLQVYAAHRVRLGAGQEVARAAAAWLKHLGGDGYEDLVQWLPNFAPGADPERIRRGMLDGVERLEDAVGGPIEATPEQQCRFMARELSPADLVPIATRLGFEEDPVKKPEKMLDFVLDTALPRMRRPLPTTPAALLGALRDAAG